MDKHRNEVILASREMAQTYIGNNGRITVTDDSDVLSEVIALVGLVKNIAKTKHILYKSKCIKSGILCESQNENIDVPTYQLDEVTLGKRVFQAISRGHKLIDEHYPIHKKNPYLELFFGRAKANHIDDNLILKTEGLFNELTCNDLANTLNQFIEEIRLEANSPDFKKKKANYLRASNKNYLETMKYVNGLFNLYSRLLVVRVDFGYHKPKKWTDMVPDAITYEDARQHRALLVKQIGKHPLFEHRVGYAIKMEHALLKGFHLHALFFFKPTVRQDVTLGQMIGNLWNTEITEGQGIYYNCNEQKHKDSYKYCGVGMVKYDDANGREGLRRAVLYITKADDYIPMVGKDKDKTFTKGVITKEKSNRGRPRK